ncbi:MAG: hypothetical protein ABW201_10430 [Candidatus Thiodiazotropha sp.]
MRNFKNSISEKRYITVINSAGFVIALVAALFVLNASYPGYLNPDSVNQLTQIITGKFNDWQSPFSTLVWAALDSIIPGPFGFVILVNVLVWGSFAILTYLFSRRIGAWSLLFLAIPFLPGAFNLLGNVHKDVLLAGWLLSASVFGYMAHQDGVSKRKIIVFQVISNLLLTAAFMTRLNAVFAILPLLLYVNHGLGWRRNILLGLFLLLMMPVLNGALLKLTQAETLQPGDSIKTFHLLGLSFVEGNNLFPGKWSDEQSQKIVEACYTPVQWDTAAFWGKCGFIHEELRRQKIWGTGKLTHKWIKEILRNPAGFFTIMSATFHKSLHDPNSRSMFYKPGKNKLFDWEVKTEPPDITTKLVKYYVTSSLNDRLGRPIVFAIAAILGLGLLTCFRGVIDKHELFAIAVMCSGLINLLSYLLVTVSAEYRYFYWSGFSIYIGSVIAVISIVSKNNDRQGYPFSYRMKLALFALIGIAVGLVAAAEMLPAIKRQVSVTPIDAKLVTVKNIRRASTPNWMGNRIDGVVSNHNWIIDKDGFYNGTISDGVLRITVPTHGLAIEVEFGAGREMGRVLVESEQFGKVVDLSSHPAGSKTIYIRPSPMHGIEQHGSLWMGPMLAVIYSFASFLFLAWIGRQSKTNRP